MYHKGWQAEKLDTTEVFIPAADSFRIERICPSLNRFLRMGPSSGGKSVYPEKIPARRWSFFRGAGQGYTHRVFTLRYRWSDHRGQVRWAGTPTVSHRDSRFADEKGAAWLMCRISDLSLSWNRLRL